eukprot:gene22703-30985_t
MVHCNTENLNELSTGSFLLGTKAGFWYLEAKEHSSAWTQHVHNETDSELALLRRVTYVSKSSIIEHLYGRSCYKVHTETIHPLELFLSMRTSTEGDIPYQTAYFPKGSKPPTKTVSSDLNPSNNTMSVAEKRKLFTTIVTPTAPLVACDDPSWGSGYWIYGGSSSEAYMYELGLTLGCAEYSNDVPGSFNFNYDYSTGRAVNPSIGLLQGISCGNCFAFLGAGLLAIAEYRQSNIYFQISVGGGAGFNASLVVKGLNISVSGSTTYDLLSEASKYATFPIGGGLSLQYKVGGLTALLSGSGQLTGSASFGAGISASATMSVLYNGSAVSFPNQAFLSSTPPYYNAKLSGYFSVRCDLTGTEMFQLSYAGFVSAAFSVQLTGYVQYTQLISFQTTSASVYAPASSTSRRLSDTGMLTFQAGDLVHIIFTYKDFHVNEEIVLFFSLSTGTDEYPIMRRKFFVNDSAGSLESVWTVPWNSILCGMLSNSLTTARIIVRASNMLTHSTETDSFALSMFSSSHSIFTTPSLSAVVPTEEPFEVIWRADLLKLFQPDSSSVAQWYGDEKVVESVSLEIVSEKVSVNGIVFQSQSFLLTNSSVPNTGSAVITIPRAISGKGSRFYLKVVSTDTLNIFGWSRYIFLDKESSLSSASSETLETYTHTGSRLLQASATAVPTASPTAQCTSYLVSGSTAAGKLGAIKIIGATVATPALKGSFTMSGPSTLCFSSSSTTTSSPTSASALTSSVSQVSSAANYSSPSLMPLAAASTSTENYYAYYNTYYYYGNDGKNNTKNPTPSPTMATSAYPTYSYSSHAVIIHRYSFNQSANDSVGGSTWNGKLKEGATISNGALNLQWTGSNRTYPHVQLPYGITQGYPILTIELWTKVQRNNGSWTHFFAFASKQNSNQNSYGLRLTGNSLTTQVTGTSSQSIADGTISASKLSMYWTYIAAVYNPKTTNITLYVNGSFVGENKAKSKPPTVGITAYNTIGASMMTLDLGFVGQIDEFRIWAGELNSSQVKSSYAAGPNAMLALPMATSNYTLAPTSAPQSGYYSPVSTPTAVPQSVPTVSTNSPAAFPQSVPTVYTNYPAAFPQSVPTVYTNYPAAFPQSVYTNYPAALPLSAYTYYPAAFPQSVYTNYPAAFPQSVYTNSPAASPQSVDAYTSGFIFTNSYASSSCSGDVLFSFGDYLGDCTNSTSSSTSYQYLIDPGSCGTIAKKTYSGLGCSGPVLQVSYLSIESYNSTTDYQMGSISCVDGIIASCAVERPYPVTSAFVMGQIYYDSCSSSIIGYVQSATSACFNSNSGTSTPYEYVLQDSKDGEFTTFQYPTMTACSEDALTHSDSSSQVTLAEQSCIL